MATNPHKKRYRKDLRDAHREYVNERKGLGYTKHPTYKQYSGLIIDFFKEMFKLILFEDYTWMTIIGTFTLSAEKREIGGDRGLIVDYRKSVDMNKRIYHLNDHSHNYVYRFTWLREGIRISNIKIYELQISGYKRLRDEYLGKKGIVQYIKDASKDSSKDLPIPKDIYTRY